ncbi:MAG: DUF58 domain-containing protein [Spirochaetaceae bacterium]|nr:MAG: DUF58 domain-containing protein [Spirochaetaceae bacterium]
MKASFLVLLLILLVLVLFFPLRILQFVTLLYLGVFGFSYLYSRIILRYVTVRRRDKVLRIHRFDPMEITLIVENRSPLPVAYLNILDEPNTFFASEPGNFLIDLRPGERKILSYPIESQHRGQYTVGPALIQGSDPLGLFPFRKKAEESQILIVYPEVLPLSLPNSEGLPAGTIRVENRIYEDVTRYRSLREYMPGDSLRRVNWKASARTGQLFVMDYLPLLYAPVLILLNLNREDYPMRFRHHRIERAATLAASLIMYFLTLRQEIGLIASARLEGGEAVAAAEIRATHEHATTLLEMLAKMEPARDGPKYSELLFSCGFEVPVRTRVEVITPVLSELDCARLRQVKERGCSVDIFLFGEEHQRYRQRYGREFSIYSVQDFGNELLYQ